MKRCIGGCNQIKPQERFSKDRSKRDGLQSWCKDCVRRYNQSARGKAVQKKWSQSEGFRASQERYRQRLTGARPLRVVLPEPLEFRFYENIVVDLKTNCWLWVGSKRRDGYVHFNDGFGPRTAHQVAYEHFIGQVPHGLELGHTCPNKCANPEHVRPITHSQNLLEGTGWL